MTQTNTSSRTWSGRALEPLWLAAAVTVPLVFNPWGYNGFELPKAMLLRALAILMGLVALGGFIEDRSGSGRAPPRRPATPLLWPTLALGAALALAAIFSANPHTSLWGSYERQQGLLTWGAYLVLFLVTATNLRTRAQVERLWTALVWGSAPIVAYGLAQALGLDPLDWRTDAASPVLSTIGRANFLGSYLVLIAPLTAGRLLSSGRRYPYLLLLGGQLICLVLTQARGAWIGLGAAALTFGLLWAAITRNRKLALAVLALTVLVAGFVALLNLPDGPMAPLANLPGLGRLAALSSTDAGSTAARLTIWRATLPLIAARPWLGYGPETMRPVFLRVFPPQLVYYQGRHTTVDRAHNLWLDLGMSAGLAGIVAFAALAIGFGRLAWQGLRNAPDRQEQIEWVALAAALAGHVADLQFSFDLTASAATFWLILALGAALRNHPLSSIQARAPFLKPTALLPYLPPLLVALVLIGLLCLRPLLADAAYWNSQQGARQQEERLSTGIRAVRLWSLEPEYRLNLAWAWAQSGDLAAAEIQLVAAERLSPHDPKVWAVRGEAHALWGEIAPDQYLQAETAYRRALELAPNVATYHSALGMILAQQGRLEEGAAESERAVALDATDGVAYSHLADLYLLLGQETKAAWARKEAVRWNEE